MCNCGQTGRTWTVTYPADSSHPAPWTEKKLSQGAAINAANKVPGATWAETPK